MNTKKNIAFIGAGNMATALIGGLRKSGWDADRILAVDPSWEQLTRIAGLHGVRTSPGPGAELAHYDVVVWSVKPQVLKSVAADHAHHAGQSLHISIAAGVRTDDLCRWFGSTRVVRAMPNTPALIGAGICGLFAAGSVSEQDKELVEGVLASTGELFWVQSDASMDAVTAISGSGPAYVFYFLESLSSAAADLGFSADEARHLAAAVVNGAVQQALRDTADYGELRQRVTSKRGPTEAAVGVLEQRKVKAAVMLATKAAYDRAKELGAELGG